MLPPIGRMAPLYRSCRPFAKSRFVNVWFYNDDYEAHLNNPVLCSLLYYEMLANHTLPMFHPSNERVIGTEATNSAFFAFVEEAAPVFDARVPASDIGVLYSPSSILSRFTPEGYTQNSQPHQFAFWGWTTALGELQYQYRSVPEWKLTSDTLADLRLLVIPEAAVFDPDAVTALLQPWVEAGGLLIVTGESGRLMSEMDNFDVNSQGYGFSPLTGVTATSGAPAEDLRTVGLGKVLYVRDNVGRDYFDADSGRVAMLPAFSAWMDSLFASTDPPLLAPGIGVTSRVGLTVFEDETAGRIFVDVVNYDIDVATDVVTPTSELVINLRIPTWLQGTALHGWAVAPGVPPNVVARSRAVDRIEVTITSVADYASVVIGAGSHPPTVRVR
jgi:hypothetical protein